MMLLTLSSIVATMIIIVIVALLAIYFAHYRHHPLDVFVPKAAWLRAGIYFCACYLAAIVTGVFDTLLTNPVVTTKQLSEIGWRLWLGGLILLVTAAYWGIWTRFTLRFDRRRDVIPQTVFGLSWGAASGLLFLSFYRFAQAIGSTWMTWQIWILAYVLIAIWQWIWQDYYWDVYISPEYDSPWSREVTPPATRSAGLLGRPRASGYVSADPENAPYLRSAHLSQ